MKGYEISNIKISGFRRLHSIDLPVKPFTVLIGANGVGKTSILDALSLLSASASSNLNSTLSIWGGANNLLTRGKAQDLSFIVEMNVPPPYKPLKYELMITPIASGYTISNENLSQDISGYETPFVHISSKHGDIRYFNENEKKLIHSNWEHNLLETSLSQVPKMFRQPEELRQILTTAKQYHVLDISSRAPIKMPQVMKPANLPGVDGEDLVPYLYNLRENDPNMFETIIDTLRAAFPDFDTLTFPPVAAGMLSMGWKDKNYTNHIYIHELSEGILRFIWLLALLYSSSLSTITMIDEPEVSLHPEMLKILIEVMREASNHTQLIIATHSDRLVDFLEPGDVVVMDIDDEGFSTATWADTMDLEAWLDEYNLGDVWHMGRMGGQA